MRWIAPLLCFAACQSTQDCGHAKGKAASFWEGIAISNVSSENVYKTGEIEFDLTVEEKRGPAAQAIQVEVTFWTFGGAGGGTGGGFAMRSSAIPHRSEHEVVLETPARKRRVVLNVKPPPDFFEGKLGQPTVEVELRVVGVTTWVE